jgi:hypothetical protein
VHAVSLTPYQYDIFEQLRKVKVISEMALLCKKMKNACGVIDTDANYNTACTFDEQF